MAAVYWTIIHKWLETTPNIIPTKTKVNDRREENREYNLKIGKRSEKTPHQRRYKDGKENIWKDAQHCVIRELQIKARYHYTPIRMSKIQNMTTSNADKDVAQQEFSFIVAPQLVKHPNSLISVQFMISQFMVHASWVWAPC